MKWFTSVLLTSGLAIADHGDSYGGGTGPYKAYYFQVEGMVNHTFYQPLESGLGSDLKLPVVVWGNGSCDKFGLAYRAMLVEIASWGAMAIATGKLYTDPNDYVPTPEDPNNPTADQAPAQLTKAIDWVYANAGQGEWAHIDKTRIAVWGHSCGGLEAYGAGKDDDRVGHIGIFNSGQLTPEQSEAVAGQLTKPVFYILGGPTDIAWENGERDYANLPASTPAWSGSHSLGHSVAFDARDAGIPGIIGRHIVQSILRGDAEAKTWFDSAEGPQSIGFVNVTSQNLESIQVSPIGGSERQHHRATHARGSTSML